MFGFRQSVEIAIDRGQAEWTRKMRIYLLEIVLDKRAPFQDHPGRLIDECLRDYPRNSHVLQKVATFYRFVSRELILVLKFRQFLRSTFYEFDFV